MTEPDDWMQPPWEIGPDLSPCSASWRMGGGEAQLESWVSALRALSLDARQCLLDRQAAPLIWRLWLGDVLGPTSTSYLYSGMELGDDPRDPRTGVPWEYATVDGKRLSEIELPSHSRRPRRTQGPG